jgi:hypothetical protein
MRAVRRPPDRAAPDRPCTPLSRRQSANSTRCAEGTRRDKSPLRDSSSTIGPSPTPAGVVPVVECCVEVLAGRWLRERNGIGRATLPRQARIGGPESPMTGSDRKASRSRQLVPEVPFSVRVPAALQ